jgi:hypothetical protein
MADERVGRRAIILACLLTLAVLPALACSGDDGDTAPTDTGSAGVQVEIESSDLALGPNRFLLTVTDPDGAEVLGARLSLRFFFIDPNANNRKTIKNSATPEPISVSAPYTHTHVDGTEVEHAAGETNIHVAEVAFDAAGDWVVEITGDVTGGRLPLIEKAFEVRRETLTPGVGDPASSSRQAVLPEADLSEIDFSAEPNPETHNTTIADAIASGRPSVIAFASQGVCADLICGPLKEAFDQLWAEHMDEGSFIHVEPYEPDAEGTLTVLPWITEEWGVQSQPWIFIVDGNGRIAAKFQAAAGLEELEAALAAVLAAGT